MAASKVVLNREQKHYFVCLAAGLESALGYVKGWRHSRFESWCTAACLIELMTEIELMNELWTFRVAQIFIAMFTIATLLSYFELNESISYT